MICNICGAQIPTGENVCKYCGNVVTMHEKKEKIQETRRIEMPPKKTDQHNIPADAQIYQPPKTSGRYCQKCGRPLDGVTHKCIVCDAAEVSRRAYINEEYKIREIDNMAQKKKKKKKTNTTLTVLLAILGTIALFLFAIIFARGKVADWMGIGSVDNGNSAVMTTRKPKNTADPNWKAEVDNKKTQRPTQEPTREPVRTPVPEPSGDPVDLRGGEYLYPSDTRVITEAELKELTRAKIKHIYWEIFARHGLTFEGELADYFENNHEWYLPTTMDESKAKRKFNSIEKRNEEIIFNYQKKMGWR